MNIKATTSLTNKAQAIFNPATQQFKRFNTISLPNLIVGTDIDHSVVPWQENEYRKKVNEDWLRGNQSAFKQVESSAVFVILTGIDYRSAQEINEILDGFPPTDIIATDNGLEMRANTRSESSKIWLAKDNDIAPNPDWEHFILNKAGWDRDLFFEVLCKVLNDLGLSKVHENIKRPEIVYPHHIVFRNNDVSPITVIFSTGESAIYLPKEQSIPSEFYQRYVDDLASKVANRYSESKVGYKIKYKISEHDKYFYIFFSPDDEIKIDKAFAFEASLKLLPQHVRSALLYAIVIGDSENDTQLKLKDVTVSGDVDRAIPVYSIVSGKNSHLLDNQEIVNHPRLIVAEEMGNIATAFKYAVERANKI